MFSRRPITHLLLFALVFTAFSAPFLMGLMRPNFKERNPYSVFYAFFNLPVTLLFGNPIRSFAESLWDKPTKYQYDQAEFLVSLLFWSLVGMAVGFYRDYQEGDSS